MKKFECEHDTIRFVCARVDTGNNIRVRVGCTDCPIDWEYIVSESDFIAAMDNIDPDPNIFFSGVLQND